MSTEMKPLVRVKVAPAASFDEILNQAQWKIRLADLVHGTFLVGLSLLLSFLVLLLLDYCFESSWVVRLIFLATTALVIGTFIVRYLVFPGIRPISRIYTARVLEQALDQPKNSLVNFVDLQGHDLPAPILAALAIRANRDIRKVDLEEATNSRTTNILGIVAGVLLLVALGLIFRMGLPRAWGHFQRVFAPVTGVQDKTITQIQMLDPAKGDTQVEIRRDLTIAVKVSGEIPKMGDPRATRIHMRNRAEDPERIRFWNQPKMRILAITGPLG